jgi:hypothetical protein
LDFYSTAIVDKTKYEKVLSALTITEKGLLLQEIFDLTKVTPREWAMFVGVFKNYMMKYRGLWKITNEFFKKAIRQKYLQDEAFLKNFHLEASQALEFTPNSVRKLEE